MQSTSPERHNGAEAEHRAGTVPLPPVLRQFWAGSAIAFGLMLLIAYVEYRMGYSRWHYNPLTGDRYQDLMEFVPVYKMLHTAAFFNGIGYSRVAYPPFGAVIYAAIYGTGHPVAFYLGSAAVWLAACVWGVRRALMVRGIRAMTATLFPLTVAVASFPIAGLLQRGNVELYLWIFAAVGTWLFFAGHEDLAAVMWGMAAAMKLYPVILLGLLLPKRMWRALGVGLGTFVGVSLASMAWLGPSIAMAWHGALRNVFGYQGERAAQWTLHELMANHTAYDLAKLGALLTGVSLGKLTLPYYACGALVIGLAFFGKLWRMPVANQLLGLTAFMVAFPPVSYYYALVQLYAPWVVLTVLATDAGLAGKNVAGLGRTLLLFLPLFATYMLFTFPPIYLFGGLVQAVMLMILFYFAMRYRFEVGAVR